MPKATTTKAASDQRPWMSGRAAQFRTGLSLTELLKLAVVGRIRTLTLPGSSVKFSSQDVAAIAKELSFPAK